ncbi:DNA polymerase III subunit epsilon [Pedobacter yulinensis]|uniref:DNA polymerase III subunit epsilon n=1 Tax=Pedobacter yulinensis TaxID=2126353 RepID=A0A2T3HMZ7_9SPHI|nr:3'-5' exonuclease [Pedobacter yulinensis]PST83815.1 DNA polymerase III subunit epsilon [Pedobacter yulinensis]
MKLQLKRPLAFFDIESTGVNVGSDRIVELAVLKAMPDGTEQLKSWRVNPGMPIPLQSSLIHGIYDEDIAQAPRFEAVAQEIADFFGESDLAGYNSNKFDIPLLLEEFLRAGIDFDMCDRKFVDVQNIFHQMEQRTLRAAYKFYCNADLINAHSAEADIRATYEVLLAQLDKYADVAYEDKQGNKSFPVKNDVEALHIFTNLQKPVDFAGRMVYNESNEIVFNFGKHKGKTTDAVFDIEPSYYAWMKQGDFPLYTKKKLDECWSAWNVKKQEQRQARQQEGGAQPQEQTTRQPQTPRPQQQQQQKVYRKPHPGYQQQKQKPDGPVTDDMLEQLKLKFGK